MVSSLKLASALLFFVTAHLLVPRIADATAKLNQPAKLNHLKKIELYKQTPSKVQMFQYFYTEYEPPNYGGPDSDHASGTR
jgi:hypothetical protein